MSVTSRRAVLAALVVVVALATFWVLFKSNLRKGQSSAILAAKQELEKFQGPWEFVSLEFERDPKREANFKKYRVEFKGDQWVVWDGTNLAAQTTIVLDPAANPKTIDAYPPLGKGLPIHGIYKFEDDKLIIFDRGEDNGERPTNFRAEPNSGLVRIVFQRVRH